MSTCSSLTPTDPYVDRQDFIKTLAEACCKAEFQFENYATPKNSALDTPAGVWQHKTMTIETKNQFSLIRVASKPVGGRKSNFLSVSVISSVDVARACPRWLNARHGRSATQPLSVDL